MCGRDHAGSPLQVVAFPWLQVHHQLPGVMQGQSVAAQASALCLCTRSQGCVPGSWPEQ